jgi:hypothetical protein
MTLSMNRRVTVLATFALLAASVAASQGAQAQQHAGRTPGDGPGHAERYEIGLLGDMPYGDPGRAQYPNVIADINRHPVAFSVFDGDTKNGQPGYPENQRWTAGQVTYVGLNATGKQVDGDANEAPLSRQHGL